MNILNRLKSKKQSEQSAGMPSDLNLAQRAQLLIAELVKDLDTPNQNIINDLITLISTLSNNPDPNIDANSIMQTANILIHELVKPVDDPNEQLIEELIHIIALSGQGVQSLPPTNTPKAVTPTAAPAEKKTEDKPDQTKAVQAEEETKKEVDAQPAAPQATKEAEEKKAQIDNKKAEDQKAKEEIKAAVQAAKAEPTQAAPKPAAQPKVDDHLLNLIMEQIKEMVKTTAQVNKKLDDMEERYQSRMSSQEQAVNNMQLKVESHENNFGDIQKAMDKFIGLYEIITNQYNPFVEQKEDDTDKTAAPPAQEQTPPPATQTPAAPQPAPAAQPAAPTPPPTAPQTAPQPQQPTPAAPQQPEPAPVAQSATQNQTPSQVPPVTDEVTQHIDVENENPADPATENLPTTLPEMVKFVKKASDGEYDTLINGDTNLLARWAKGTLQNEDLSQKFLQKPSKVEASKLLMKEVLKAKVAAQRARQ